MRAELHQMLICPDCGEPLGVDQAWASDAIEVLEGSLRCQAGHRFAIIGGIPRLVPRERCWQVERRYPAFFRNHADLVAPRRPEAAHPPAEQATRQPSIEYWRALDQRLAAELRGSLVLDAECGDGANALAYADAGAEVIAMGATGSVDQARDRTRSRAVSVIEADVRNPPLAGGRFDRVLCMSLMACDRDPRATLVAMVGLLRPGGVFEGHARISVEELDRTGRALGFGIRLAGRIASRFSLGAGRAAETLGHRVVGRLFGGRRPRFSRDDLGRALADAGLESVEVRDLGGWVATGRRPLPLVEVEPVLTPRERLKVLR